MEPTGDLWAGVGTGIANSPGWMVVGALLVVSVAYIVARYIVPSHEKVRMRRLDIEQQQAQTDAERVKANSALAENMRGLRESNDRLAEQSAALFAGIEESKARSRSMGDEVGHIRATTDHTAEQVEDIHRHLFREGTD